MYVSFFQATFIFDRCHCSSTLVSKFNWCWFNLYSSTMGSSLVYCGLVMQYDIESLVNAGAGDGLVPDGTKPLPEPMLKFHRWGLLSFTWGNFTGHSQHIYPWYEFESNLRLQLDLPGVNVLNKQTIFYLCHWCPLWNIWHYCLPLNI